MVRGKTKTGTDDFFSAVEALTWREMRDVAGLIALQMAESGKELTAETVAEALVNAADSHTEED